MNLVWRLAAATTLIVLAFSMTGPVLAILLQQAGHGTRTIGAFAMLPFLLVGLLIPVVPRVLARWGTLRVYRAGVVLEVAGALGHAWGDGLLAWSVSSIVSGAAHASSTGLRLGVAATVAGAIGIGSFLCQYPAGRAADRFAPGHVFGVAAVLLLAASVAIGWAGQAPWLLWACGLVWGGVGGALYTLAMIQVAHAFAGRATGGGTAAVITGYTVGGALGPLASGAALQGNGLAGLAAVLGCVALAALTAATRMGRTRLPAGA